jgi:hypothetical protein
MDEEFGSFVVTDPDIVDEGIDVSGLRTKTDTSLLGNIPELAGVQYEAFNPNRLSDLMRFYQTGLPTRSVSQPTTPPATGGGGGSGGGGQATTPITTPVITPTTSITDGTNVDTPLTQMITDPVTGQTQTVKQAMTSDAAYTGTPSSPFLASGAAGGASLAKPTTATTTLPSGDVFATDDPMLQEKIDFTPQQQGTIQNILGQAGQTVDGALSAFGKIPGAVVDAANQTVDLFGKKINIGKTLAGAALNTIAGAPVSLVLGALPERDPRQNKLDDFYTEGEGAKFLDPSSPDYIPGMEDYNTVSGGLLNTITGGRAGTPTTFGLQGAYQKRIDTIENTLKDKYNMSDAEIADAKAGKYKGDVDTDLIKRIEDLGDAKKAEADILGITAAEDKRQGEADMKQTVADAIRERDLGAGPRATTQPTITEAPVTGVTRPGTVLGKPGIERFDDAEASIDMFDDLPPGASTTGTPIDSLNPINRQQHFDNTEKLKDAVRAGEITPEEYNRLSAFDATKTMGLGPVTGTAATIGYQGIQTLAGDQTVGDMMGDIGRNIQGVAGNITPEEQVKYQEIITGEKIYRDPILGMVEPPAPMTLADDTINRMVDDVDLDLFDLPEPTPTPVGTFDADTFDDDVSLILKEQEQMILILHHQHHLHQQCLTL